jgi:hypothetical protein
MRKVQVGFISSIIRSLNPKNDIKAIFFGLCLFTLTALPLVFAEAQVKPIADSLRTVACGEPSLQEILDGLGYSINVSTDETGIELWPVVDLLYMEIMYAEVAHYAPFTSSGWYKAHSPNDTTIIFIGDDVPVDTAYFYVTGADSMGLFINPVLGHAWDTEIPLCVDDIWYTEISLCSDNGDHAWVFLTGNPHEFIVAWEDLPKCHWDADYQDLVLLFRPPDQPPVLTVPADFDTFLCEPALICFDGISAYDPDYNDRAVIDKLEEPGSYNRDTHTLCFLPEDVDSVYKFIFKATDIEGATDQDTVQVTVDIDGAPTVTAPDTVEFSLCDTATVCFDISIYDPDDDELTVWVDPLGEYNSSDTSICFFAHKDTTYNFTIIVAEKDDEVEIGGDKGVMCGTADTAYVVAVVGLNQPPQLTVPEDFDTLLCDTGTVCIEVGLVDSDGNGFLEVRESGYSVESYVCFSAYQEKEYCLDIIGMDSCGASDSEEVCIGVSFSEPPVVEAPDVWIFIRQGETKEFNFTASDPDEEVLKDDVELLMNPDCGEYSAERIAGSGTSSGEWKLTFKATDCAVGFDTLVVKVEDGCGNTGEDSVILAIQRSPSDIDEPISERITSFFLRQNYPNPFNLNTEISFQLPYECKVDLRIYNLRGQLVKTVIDKELDRGVHTFFWDGRDNAGKSVASGIYFYKLKASDYACVKKMILLK